MSIPYRHAGKIPLNQQAKPPVARDLGHCDAVLLILPETADKHVWSALPHGEFLAERARQRRAAAGTTRDWATELPNPRGTRVQAVYVKPGQSTFDQLSAARGWAKQLLDWKPARVGVYTAPGTAASALLEAAVLALLAASCPLPNRKSAAEPTCPLARIDCYGATEPLRFELLRAQVQGNHLARWLTQLPGNELRPGDYRKLATALAKQHGWQVEFLDRKSLSRRKAGAFLAVTQASHVDDGGLLRLSYRPKGRAAKPKLALVGKGICFDTGGVNLKSAKSMHGMHEDMEGSAVALGTLLALSLLKVDFAVDCWLALAENHIGPQGYKPNDVVTACNGTSIEIVHTDAEGRMVLADALALASREKPTLIIDYATLTGACVYALSTRYSGVFGNRDALLVILTEAGKHSGERVWPFPMDADFDAALKSDIADIKQCTLDSEADHILAARFLNRFVPQNIAWLHVDLSAGNHKGGLAHIPSDVTGFGVGLTVCALLEHGLLNAARDN
ncbi:MAG: leucyl aminopeptidase family protein [Gammaproteobacteria bacterium]|nr:leucyl aminopeptidase family protein [Gammaproteobacteria bacterium]